jgi:Biotin carboxyl carrier protein
MRTTFENAVTGGSESGVSAQLNGSAHVKAVGDRNENTGGMSRYRSSGSEGESSKSTMSKNEATYRFGYRDALEIMQLVEKAEGLASVDLRVGDVHISIKRAEVNFPDQKPAVGDSRAEATAPAKGATAPTPQTPQPVSAAKSDTEFQKIITPTLGVFYRRPSPEAEPFVKEGDVITEGDQIGVLEVMKLYMPINSTVSGRVVRIVAQDATLVEHGEVLMLVEPV